MTKEDTYLLKQLKEHVTIQKVVNIFIHIM